MKLGSINLSKMYVGVSEVIKAYIGSTQTYSNDPYYVGNFLSPELTFDFGNEYYRTDGTDTTFPSAITHSRASNATMVDNDGLLKWAPHNLLTYSEQFDSSSWGKSQVVVTPDAAPSPSGNASADAITPTATNGVHYVSQSLLFGTGHKVEVFAKSNGYHLVQIVERLNTAHASEIIDLSDGSTFGAVGTGGSTQVFSIGGGWYKIAWTPPPMPTLFNNSFAVYIADPTATAVSRPWNEPWTPNGTDGVYLWGAHLYRSDLGGMVDNPDRGDSYVPTTSAARYLPRRGHHVYNGAEWVNEGLLHESEARTNLLHTTNALVTQSLTVTAVPHTLHFTGTGTVTLLGASTSGPLVGTGTGENNRVSLTFTPTAASLTLAVTGTVTNAQLEVGSTPSSYIPNLAASGSVTRAADTLTVPSANLPWPTPNVIGEELVTNGTFDTDVSGWTEVGGTLSLVSNKMRLTSSSGTAYSRLDSFGVTSGSVYKVSFDVSNITASQVQLWVGSGYNLANWLIKSGITSTQTVEAYFVAQGAVAYFELVINATTGQYADFDNISVREIDPLAVSIQMQGRMTYADEGLSFNNTFWRWYINSGYKIEAYLSTLSADTGNVIWDQRDPVSGADLISSGATTYSPGINVPFNIASRHGSTFINGAVDGTALMANLTPTALPDLSSTDLEIAYDYMGTISLFRIWDADLGDSGIEEVSS